MVASYHSWGECGFDNRYSSKFALHLSPNLRIRANLGVSVTCTGHSCPSTDSTTEGTTLIRVTWLRVQFRIHIGKIILPPVDTLRDKVA